MGFSTSCYGVRAPMQPMNPSHSSVDAGALCARASRLLGAGDSLGVLNTLGVLENPHARALRGIALAQLGAHDDALQLLDEASRLFDEAGDASARARALAARAEVRVAQRELGVASAELEFALDALSDVGDARNRAWLLLVRARLSVLAGDLPCASRDVDEARAIGAGADDALVLACAELARSEGLARRLRGAEAYAAAEAARDHAARAEHALLRHETATYAQGLLAPLARVIEAGAADSAASVVELGALLDARGDTFVLDALRRRWIAGRGFDEDLASRTTVFGLLATLVEQHPDAVAADALVARLFDGADADESHRARLKTALARLRRSLGANARVVSEAGALRLCLPDGARLVRVVPWTDDRAGQGASVLEAMLWDGAAWSARSLAVASGMPLRSVQRRLGELVDAGAVRAVGGSRSMRYARCDPRSGFVPQVARMGIARW